MSDPIGDDVLILDRDFIVKTAKKFREEHEMAEMEPIKVEMDLTYRTVAVLRMYKMGRIVRKEKGDVVKIGGRFAALSMKRFSSGILSLDVALGGGWPFSRVVIVAGNESTGK